PEESLRVIARDPDPARRPHLLGFTTHELCDGLALPPTHISELAHDLQPRAHDHGAGLEADPMERLAGLRLRADEEVELERLVAARLDLGEQLVQRIRVDLQLLQPGLPRDQLRIAGLQTVQRALQFDEPPERDRIPVLRRRHALQLLEGALPIATVIEEMPQVDPGLVVVRVELQRAAQIAASRHFVPEPVERVSERGHGLGAVRAEIHGLGEDVARVREHPLPVERAPHGEEQVQVLVATVAARLLEEVERVLPPANAEHDLPEADQRILVLRIEDQRLLECLLGPDEFLPGEAGVAEAHVELDRMRIEAQTFLQRVERRIVVTLVVQVVRTFVVLLGAEERSGHTLRLLSADQPENRGLVGRVPGCRNGVFLNLMWFGRRYHPCVRARETWSSSRCPRGGAGIRERSRTHPRGGVGARGLSGATVTGNVRCAAGPRARRPDQGAGSGGSTTSDWNQRQSMGMLRGILSRGVG